MYEKGQTIELTTQQKTDINNEPYIVYYSHDGANHNLAEGWETVTLTQAEADQLNKNSWFTRPFRP